MTRADPPSGWTRARRAARTIGYALFAIYGALAVAFFAWLIWEVGIGPY